MSAMTGLGVGPCERVGQFFLLTAEERVVLLKV